MRDTGRERCVLREKSVKSGIEDLNFNLEDDDRRESSMMVS